MKTDVKKFHSLAVGDEFFEIWSTGIARYVKEDNAYALCVEVSDDTQSLHRVNCSMAFNSQYKCIVAESDYGTYVVGGNFESTNLKVINDKGVLNIDAIAKALDYSIQKHKDS